MPKNVTENPVKNGARNGAKNMLKNAALIVAAGHSRRMESGIHKPYVDLAGRSVLARALTPFIDHPEIDRIQIVIHKDDEKACADVIETLENETPINEISGNESHIVRDPQGKGAKDKNIKRKTAKILPPIIGGDSRQQSVMRGMEVLKGDHIDKILIHDGARPFVGDAIITRVLDALDDDRIDGAVACAMVHDSVITLDPAIDPPLSPPIAATTKSADGIAPSPKIHAPARGQHSGQHSDQRPNQTRGQRLDQTQGQIQGQMRGQIRNMIDRAPLRRSLTPQGFCFNALYRAHKNADHSDYTDDTGVALASGLTVVAIDDSDHNQKITTRDDLERARHMLASRDYDIRVGHGFDVHRLVRGSGMILCGVPIDHPYRLSGHSDADVGLHALTDAILGALAMGDIGTHFPPDDDRFKGADSKIFLDFAYGQLSRRAARLNHIDMTFICETPKLGPYRDAMVERLSRWLNLDRSRVSIKATTSERLGFTGRGEGIAAMACVTLAMRATTG